MAVILYTTTDAVRAALGVTVRELDDGQITDLTIVDQLEVELDTVYADHVALKAKIDALTATTEEQAIWKRLKLYVLYEAAVIMLSNIQLWSAQKITDSDVEMQRFMKDNLQDTIDRITALRDKYAALVNPTLFPDGALYSHLTTVVPDYDPVTDEGGT